MKSATRVQVDLVSKAAFVELFKPRGFRRKSSQIHREIDGVAQIVNFQASAWGSAQAGRFTINVGVTAPRLVELWTGSDAGSTNLWRPIDTRIGHLMQAGDHWWPVGPDIDPAPVRMEVLAALRDHVLPLFERFSNRTALYEAMAAGLPDALATFLSNPLLRALGHHGLGHRDETARWLQAAQDEASSDVARHHIDALRARLAAEVEIPFPAKSA